MPESSLQSRKFQLKSVSEADSVLSLVSGVDYSVYLDFRQYESLNNKYYSRQSALVIICFFNILN